MKRWLRRGGAAALLAGALTGCANVKVEKVDLQKRIDGQDECVKGFRYYLTRPYLVVGSRVTVSTTYIPASVAVFPADAKAGLGQPLAPGAELVLVAQVPDGEGQYRVYDRAGKLRPDLRPGQVRILQPGASEGVKPPNSPNYGFIDVENKAGLETANLLQAMKLSMPTTVNHQDWEDFLNGTTVKTAITKYADPANNNKNTIQSLASATDPAEKAKAVPIAAHVALQTINAFLHDNTPQTPKLVAKDAQGKSHEITDAELADLITKALAAKSQATTPMAPAAPQAAASDIGAATLVSNGAKAAPAAAPAGGDGGNGGNGGGAATAPEAFQVIFLPDFEEQYAIRNVNVLAKTKYKYTFRNGTDLETMAGAYDGTDVPIEILNTVGSLVKAFGAVAQTRLNPSGGAGAGAALTLQANQEAAAYYVRIEQAIEPGVYRVQKSWERAAAAPLDGVTPDQACGLFADVGLPILETSSVITADQYNTFNPPPAKPADVNSK